MAAPVKHTCPDIDKCIKIINEAIKTAEYGMKENDRKSDNWNLFTEIINSIEDCEGILEQLRSDNDELRAWGTEQEDNVESCGTYINELEEKIKKLESLQLSNFTYGK